MATIQYSRKSPRTGEWFINEDIEPRTVVCSGTYTETRPTKPASNLPMQPNRHERRKLARLQRDIRAKQAQVRRIARSV